MAVGVPQPEAWAQKSATRTERQSTVSKKKKGRTSGKRKSSAARKPSAHKQRETSSDVKRQEAAARQEIKKTEAEIRANDKEISKGISNLRKIEGDIAVSKKEVSTLTSQVGNIKGRIAALEGQIVRKDSTLKLLRAEYLKAVKKMRVARKKNSDMAFLFSSGSFSQAMRRMRYLRDFSAWKDRQSREIGEAVAQLKESKQKLASNQRDLNETLGRRVEANNKLERQRASQDAIVVELRRNGEALRTHLSRKQAEANQLRGRVASLIAQEEEHRRQVEAEEARRAEERARQQEQARRERERRQEEQRQAEERAERERQQAEARAEKDKKQDKPAAPKKENKKDVRKADAKPNVPAAKPGKGDRTYADARRRRPRGEASGSSAPKQSAPSGQSTPPKQSPAPAPSGSGFEGMKGRLPRPVAGEFRVVSQFGRQSLPDMPDVVYDNPGIDAEVAKGSSALAVYPGKVSAVYVVPGFSTVVILSHNGYYTVYGNIASPSVKMGDNVKQGQGLGRLAEDADNPSKSSIHFEVWRKRDKLNPLSWIR